MRASYAPSLDKQSSNGNGRLAGDEADELRPSLLSVADLCAGNPELRPPIIHGVLRAGETMNLVSAPKIGKSWLAMQLAISIAAGRAWLERFAVETGDVLIIDNELHAATIAHRIPKVAAAMGVMLSELRDRLFVESLRGRLRDVYAMGSYFRALEPGRLKLIIVDAFYRILPRDADENSNADLASIYNAIDRYADMTGAGFVLIHHSSKGIQSGKAVTDVGAGAGSQSRATDAHLILRQHAEDGAVTLEAAVRSWAPVSAFCCRWQFPIWRLAEDLDPTDLRREKRKGRIEEKEADATAEWTAAKFVESFITEDPQTVELVLAKAAQADLSARKAKSLLALAESEGIAHRWTYSNRRAPHKISTQPQPVTEAK